MTNDKRNRLIGLRPDEWQDLIVLLRILEGWLLVAEPSTIRELDAYLKSEGICGASTDVLAGLEGVIASAAESGDGGTLRPSGS
jgi:hypothetical protein